MKRLIKKISIFVKTYEGEHPFMTIFWTFVITAVAMIIGGCFFYYYKTSVYSKSEKVEFIDEEFQTEMQAIFKKDDIYEEDLLQLTNLEIMNNKELVDISDLEKCENLTQLTITNCSVSDLTVLSKLNRLKIVNLNSNNIWNLNGIENMKVIEEFDLRNNHIDTIEPLCTLTSLKKILISGNNLSSICREIDNLEDLICLDISNNRLTSIDEVKKVPSLTELYANNNIISQTPDLDGMENLNILGLSGNAFIDLSSLGLLENLEKLNLSVNYLDSFEYLEGLPKLQELHISYNQYSTLKGLEVCSTLQYLDIRGTFVEDVAVLEDMPEFNTIYLDDDFDRTQLDFMIGNFRNGDLLTKQYLLEKQYDIHD